ncbi:hypothetical protein IGI04_023634, partial [Brassica rapa subsp. trilocularis]
LTFAPGSHTLLAELSLFKPLLPVRVKVISKGRTEGNTIQATLFRDLDASTEMPLKEGHCYEIKNFKLTHALECVQLTKNRYYINLSNSFVILKIDPIHNSNFYCFPNFIDVYCGLVHPKFPIVTSNVAIKCVAYRALAHVFQYLWNSTDANIVLCVLQFWQINWGVDRLKNITNIDGFSKIVFESNDVLEIDAFRLKIVNEEL